MLAPATIRRLAAALGALVAGAPPAGAGAESLAGRVWDVRAESFVPPDAAIARAAASDFVLLGEIHDNPAHHRLQAEIVAGMAAAGRRPAVVWEMIPARRQPDIDRWRASGGGDGPGAADRLAAAVDWADSGWPDWTLYRPIAEAALAAGLAIRAGGPDPARGRAPELDAKLPPAQEAALLDALYEGHCRLIPRASLGPMLAAQRARDAALADAMVAADRAGSDGAVLIAGAGHTRRDVAVPDALARTAPGRSVLSIAFVEVGPDVTDAASLARPGAGGAARHDLLWLTPPGPEEDHCAALAKRLGKGPE